MPPIMYLRQPSVVGPSPEFMQLALSYTFVLGLLTTWLAPVRHDIVALAIGFPTLFACGSNQIGAIFLPLYLAVPLLGGKVGQKVRSFGLRKTANNGVQGRLASSPP